MAKITFSESTLNAEQQTEAELIYQRIRGAFDDEARRLAQLMASKETRQIFGETEYQVRDRVHALGAQVLEAAAEERVKKKGGAGRQLASRCRTWKTILLRLSANMWRATRCAKT